MKKEINVMELEVVQRILDIGIEVINTFVWKLRAIQNKRFPLKVMNYIFLLQTEYGNEIQNPSEVTERFMMAT